MSELQVALLILAVVFIGAILGLNWWQERQSRRFSGALGPAAIRRSLNDTRLEPGSGAGPAARGNNGGATPASRGTAGAGANQRGRRGRNEPLAESRASQDSNRSKRYAEPTSNLHNTHEDFNGADSVNDRQAGDKGFDDQRDELPEHHSQHNLSADVFTPGRADRASASLASETGEGRTASAQSARLNERANERPGEQGSDRTNDRSIDRNAVRTAQNSNERSPDDLILERVTERTNERSNERSSANPVSHSDSDLDEGTEGIIDVRFASPVLGELLAPVVAGLRHAGAKTVRSIGVTPKAHFHKTLRAAENYAGLRLGVLLSNRSGPITRMEFEEYVKRVKAQLHPFAPSLSTGETVDILKQAQQLDAILAQLDRQLGITLVSRGQPWRIDDVREACLEAGFQVSDDGRLVWIEDAGDYCFVVSHSDTTPLYLRDSRPVARFLLLLDVPHVLSEPSPFALMAQASRDLSTLLDGDIVDDSGRELTEEAEEKILEHLEWIYKQMDQAGLAPGSNRASRVFS